MRKKRRFGGSLGSASVLLASLLLVLVFAVPSTSAQAGAQPLEAVPIPPLETVVDSASLVLASDGNPKLGSSLSQLIAARQRGPAAAQAYTENHLLVVDGSRIQVEILTTAGVVTRLIQAIEGTGGEYEGHYQDLVQATVPVDSLDALAARPDVLYVREPRRAIAADTLDIAAVTSEGVAASNAAAWHGADFTGAGIRVAIVDGGFKGYAVLLGTELPNKVKTYDHVGSGLDATDHGTAVAEIVHDMAPEAKLSLHRVSTAIDLSQAITQAAADGADVISMSMGWILGGRGDGTGTLANIVADARAEDILFVAAAHNLAERGWIGTFVDRPLGERVYHAWDGGNKWVNLLGPGTGSCYIIPAGTYIKAGLHWDDWSTRNQDYDLHLYYYPLSGSKFYRVASSTNPQDGVAGQSPEEFIGFQTGYTGCYGFVVEKVRADRNVCMRLLMPVPVLHLDEWTPARTLGFPADAPTTMTVAAVDVGVPYNLEPYSSQGPTLGPGGACTGGTLKPDVAAFANVSTARRGPTGFNGTSAATPHVGGAAALVRAAYPGYTAALTQSLLESRAVEMGPSGKDTIYGAGRLYLGAPPVDYDYQIWLPTIVRAFPGP